MRPGSRTAHILLPVLLVLCMPEWVFVQRASVTGTVQDSTGAIVPLARVTAQNKAIAIYNRSASKFVSCFHTQRVIAAP